MNTSAKACASCGCSPSRWGGWRDVRVSHRRTAVDWAHHVQALGDDTRYADAQRITLVCDNLNTHKLVPLYEAFGPTETLRIANLPCSETLGTVIKCFTRRCALGEGRLGAVWAVLMRSRAWFTGAVLSRIGFMLCVIGSGISISSISS